MKSLFAILSMVFLLSGCDNLSVFEIVEREDGSLVRMNRITGTLYIIERTKEKEVLTRGKHLREIENENMFPQEDYIYSCFMEIDGNYRLGHNKMYEGIMETQTVENERGDILQVLINSKVYEAKGYFERFILKLDTLKAPDGEMSQIGNLLVKAAKKRIEAIDLFTQGLFLKEQIGKISVANMLASFEGGSPTPLPQYSGEIERGAAKKTIADAFLVDGMVLMKKHLGRDFFDEEVLLRLSEAIAFYSDVNRVDFDMYLNFGKSYLEEENYYDAIIEFKKALKVYPENKKANSGLIKTYIGLGFFELADSMIDTMDELEFSTEEIDAIREHYDNSFKEKREKEMEIAKLYKDGNVYLEIQSNKNSINVNDAIILETKLYLREIGLKDIEYPDYVYEGFEKGETKKPERIVEKFQGEDFDVLVFRQTFIAEEEGIHTIGPATIGCKVIVPRAGSRGYYEYFTVIKSGEIIITVRED